MNTIGGLVVGRLQQPHWFWLSKRKDKISHRGLVTVSLGILVFLYQNLRKKTPMLITVHYQYNFFCALYRNEWCLKHPWKNLSWWLQLRWLLQSANCQFSYSRFFHNLKSFNWNGTRFLLFYDIYPIGKSVRTKHWQTTVTKVTPQAIFPWNLENSKINIRGKSFRLQGINRYQSNYHAGFKTFIGWIQTSAKFTRSLWNICSICCLWYMGSMPLKFILIEKKWAFCDLFDSNIPVIFLCNSSAEI